MRRLKRAIALVALASLIPAYWIAASSTVVGLYHDDGVYVMVAEALSKGHGL
jgi:hypothetical protein